MTSTTRRALFAAAAGAAAFASVPVLASLGRAIVPATPSAIQSLNDEYFAIKRACNLIDTGEGEHTDDEIAALGERQGVIDEAVVEAVPDTVPDMIAYLEVAIADFEQFHMDDGKGGLDYLPDNGERMAYLSMVHSLRLFRTMAEQVSA